MEATMVEKKKEERQRGREEEASKIFLKEEREDLGF